VPTEALTRLKEIRTAFAAFCNAQGGVTEADTRAKVIDRVLVEICGWPESEVAREEHTERGYMDYSLRVLGRPFVCVEAKREGIPFVLPVGQEING
jgi:predicted type IV restriction endonuclease